MEKAPLTSAHSHVQNLHHNPAQTPSEAIHQHEQAASSFSSAATSVVDDPEAFRALSLLQEHHAQLSRIIRSHSSNEPSQSHLQQDVTSSVSLEKSRLETGNSVVLQSARTGAGGRTRSSQQLPQQRRPPPRDLSASIASNLATARGIPKDKQRRVDGKTRKPERERQEELQANPEQTSIVEDKSTGDNETNQEESHSTINPTSDLRDQRKDDSNPDPFGRFYSTFEGLISKISAPLGFAGLPLIPEEEQEQARQNQVKPQVSPSPADIPGTTGKSHPNEPADAPRTHPVTNLNQIYSQNTIDALKSEHPELKFNTAGNVQESFFVVPPTGGSSSYAGVLTREPHQHSRLSSETSFGSGGGETFVDAEEEIPAQNQNKASRRNQMTVTGPRSGKTLEELEMENESLKHLTDNLSKRLYMWERSAQSQSMVLRSGAAGLKNTSSGATGAASEPEAEGPDVKELEAQVVAAKKEAERYSRENEKLKGVVTRYRERWEKLKEGARNRRESVSEH